MTHAEEAVHDYLGAASHIREATTLDECCEWAGGTPDGQGGWTFRDGSTYNAAGDFGAATEGAP